MEMENIRVWLQSKLKYRDVLFLHHIILHQSYTKTHWVWDPCIWDLHAWVSHPMCLGVKLMQGNVI
jgi:hypothetical protein